jgi:thiamine kinase-like enzyme
MACNTDPHYEFGCLLNEAYVFEEQMRAALERTEGSVHETVLNRCRLYAIADDLYWGLWAALMNATSERRGIEFLKYANWRLLRCRMAIRDYGFERMLRAI